MLTVTATPSGTALKVAITVAPNADAGGPYTVAEGAGLTLDGSGSAGAEYAWDLNGDDDFTDATGMAPALTWDDLEQFGINDGPATYEIALEVTSNGVSSVATGAINVTNTAPQVTLSGDLTPIIGVPFTIKVGADDPSSADMAALFTYTVDWGDGSPVETVVGPSDPPLTHTYTAVGTFTPIFTVTDKDGGGGAESDVPMQVAPAPTTTTSTPTTTAAPTTTPSPSTTLRPGGQLPATGGQPGDMLLVVVLLLMVGLGMIVIARLPATTSRHEHDDTR
jgi:hypothetical protein